MISFDSLSHEGMQEMGMSMPLNLSFASVSDDKSRDHDSNMVDLAAEDNTLALKLSSYLMQASENHPSSNNESTNFPTDSSLTIKAATVTSQWLELIHQDIKGRLPALHNSKKRDRVVITAELPFLIAKEFSSNQENDPYTADGCSSNTMAEMHRARWGSLFDQMDKSLSEEETPLIRDGGMPRQRIGIESRCSFHLFDMQLFVVQGKHNVLLNFLRTALLLRSTVTCPTEY